MNRYQELWWQQAQSDHRILVLLRRNAAPPCHQLHFLQMVVEKLGKAYFWRSGHQPPRKHSAFVRFLRALGSTHSSNRLQVAQVFGFKRFEDFQAWIRTVLPLAYELGCLAPALAQDGPNPEYPWPGAEPRYAPANYSFPVWPRLVSTGKGRQLMQVIEIAAEYFAVYS